MLYFFVKQETRSYRGIDRVMSPRISPKKILSRTLLVTLFLLIGQISFQLDIFIDYLTLVMLNPVLAGGVDQDQPAHWTMSSQTSNQPSIPGVRRRGFHIDENENYDVLILAYMNSGSSFVGKILGGREDTFYWYEPLWSTHKWRYLSKNGEICDFRRDTCIPELSNGPKSIGRTLEFLSDIFKCNNLSQYHERFVEEIMGNPNNTGYTGDMFTNCKKKCTQERPNNTYSMNCATSERSDCSCHSINSSSLNPSSSQVCFDVIVNRCERAKHRVTKVLRIDASLAQDLLDRHKRLKLLHIFRDPRAIINSRLNTQWFYKNLFYNFSTVIDIRTLCGRIDKDLTTAKRLLKLYPDRVKIVQYEDFYNARRLANALYKFAGMDPKQNVGEFIEGIADERDGFHPDNYRLSLKWEVVKEINKQCLKQIKRLGLRVFESESELRNRTSDLVVNKLPFSID